MTIDDLRRVQRRGEFPTRMTQRLQVFIQNRVIGRVLSSRARPKAPLAFRMMGSSAMLRRLVARIIGIGFRPEHVKSP